ncbi:SMC family ATPase [Cellulomonas sp. DKR-3]|uniref:Nuclease SbcCD subunit C n=1 Tax=Cellulomonas fulva TaxID=2835530 RepID=A0ABS5TWB9_9CELL|nr:SMC family ATPase [Cellulomonas fulva]MBT0993387.1 SMC family ATPase [Cellulomonas fulva]
MQLHTLTLQAIGPFAGRHVVDFSALAASGLFLLEGPTGAGKSTVIDAVVFALYGKVASADASEDRLRSAYAGDETESFVDLTFEVPSGRFRVRRTPAYERAKKRGSGTVRQQASVRLWRLSAGEGAGAEVAGPAIEPPGGEVLSTRLDEAGAEIQRIVGLDRTQFVQTIVLPQGEFARFLRADPEDRRGLLQKIFGTQVYEDLQARLAQLRRDAERAAAAGRAVVDDRVAHLAGAARLDPEALAAVRAAVDEVVAGGPLTVVEDALAVTTGALSARAAQAAQQAALAATAHREAGVRLTEQRELGRLVALRDGLLAERAALAEADEAQAEASRRLVAAQAARALRPLLQAADEAAQTSETARKSLLAARDVAPADLAALVPGEDAPADGAAASRTGLAAEQSAAVAAAAALERALDVEARLTAVRLEARQARGAVEDRDTEIAAHDAWLAARPAALEELTAALRTVRGAADQEAELALAARAADALVDAHRSLAGLLPRHEAAAALVEERAVAAQAAVVRESSLRSARIAGLAGELAADLADGAACPVCGSCEHPVPAALAADHVTVDAVQAAETVRQAAEAALGAAREAHAALETEVAAARAATAGSTPEEAEQAHGSAAQALADCRDAGRRAVRLTRDVDEHREATQARERTRLLAVAERERAALVVDTLQAAVEEAEAEVARARGTHPTVAARHAELVERAATAADLLAALDEAAGAAADLGRRRTALAHELEHHGFDDVAAARAASAGDAQIEALDRVVREHAAATERVRAGLADPAVAGLAPDVTGAVVSAELLTAQQAEGAAAAELARASGEAGVTESIGAAADAAAEELRAAVARHRRQVEEAAPVLRLAGLAAGTGGDNATGLSLATYVLVRRFEDVVAAANARLVGMSDGRFELVRSDRKEDVSSRRTGLAMRVLDHHTEQQRDPRTLSGGETFYVSLCLALGMADVVTAEAGGIDLGTLFVDEGFGSLDPRTLDQVLAELDHLRAGGRVVGVVSHVEALKQTIADRIEIRRTAAGPSTLVVRAG